VQNPFALVEHDPAIVFALNRELRIIYCNAAWDRFAQLNGGRLLLQRPRPYSLCVLDVMPECLIDLYDPAYRGVFTTGREWVLEYECSSDVVYRLFRMTVIKRPEDDFILSVNFLLEERPHGQERQIAIPDSMAYGAPGNAVVMCCFCRRTQRIDGRGWDWVPAYVQNHPTRVVQGICKGCYVDLNRPYAEYRIMPSC
jgi:PAS domain-containing protein